MQINLLNELCLIFLFATRISCPPTANIRKWAKLGLYWVHTVQSIGLTLLNLDQYC